jgi:PTS system mannose-specific IIA component
MIEVAEFILGEPLAAVRCVPFRQSAADSTGDEEIRKAIASADQGSGVLVMTDVGGASPCNHVARLQTDANVAVVSGLNLAMLIRVWNYRSKPLRQLVELATEGAIRDIMEHSK